MRLAATLVLLLALGTSGWTNEMKDLCGARAGCSCGWWGMQLVEICPGGVPKDEETVFDAEGKFREHSEGAVSLACYRDLQEALRLAMQELKVRAFGEAYAPLCENPELVLSPHNIGIDIHCSKINFTMERLQAIAARCAPEKGKE